MGARALIAFGVLPLLLAACGGGGDDVATPDDNGVVNITMKDISFDPDVVEVEAGQTVTFNFKNEGALVHEAFIGTEAEQEAHEAEMNPEDTSDTTMEEGTGQDSGTTDDSMGDEQMPGDDSSAGQEGMQESMDALFVDPGESASLEYTFDEAGTMLIGCHEPGHYAAGMRVTVDVR